MKRDFNIAILGRDFHLSGGADFLRNLVNALLSVSNEHKLRIFLLMPVKNKVDRFSDLFTIIRHTVRGIFRQRKFMIPRVETVFDSTFHDYFKNIDGVIEFVEYNEATGLIFALQRIEADVVIPAANSLGRLFPFPWVGYFYDFQHKYYPDYFSARECLSRDIHFATMLRDAQAIVVNSKSVKDDIHKFYPYSNCKIFNLPFSASSVSSWLKEDNPDIPESYGLPSRYFLISNQFWTHKSHLTAFQALSKLLKEPKYADLHIVCTGKQEDYRFPDHIQNLQQEIRNLEIVDKIHFLGHIPKIDQVAIMKESLAVLQPTLFEGGPGGGAVYDAVSLGIPAIISDIPVNKEIENEENLFYFQAGSSSALADKIRTFLNQDIKRPTKEELITRGEQRKR
ncbi:glycosyltransferase, partial [Thermodesulfobacteriota bacterium]